MADQYHQQLAALKATIGAARADRLPALLALMPKSGRATLLRGFDGGAEHADAICMALENVASVAASLDSAHLDQLLVIAKRRGGFESEMREVRLARQEVRERIATLSLDLGAIARFDNAIASFGRAAERLLVAVHPFTNGRHAPKGPLLAP